jgi:hypothetical protein
MAAVGRHPTRKVGILVLLVMIAVAGSASGAWASFRATRVGSTSVSAHGLVTPSQPTCSGLGLATVRLTWAAPSDAGTADAYGTGNLADGYEVGKATVSSAGPFTFVDNGTSTSFNVSTLLSGDTWFVVRTYKHSWRSVSSAVRQVHVAVVGLLASCP